MKDQHNTPLVMLTVGQLLEILQGAFDGSKDNSQRKVIETEKKYVYGVRGLANLLGCSVSTAQRRVGSGMLENCIIRNGRLLIFDQEKVLLTLKGGTYHAL